MRSAIAELVYKIRELEAELEADLAEKSREWHYRFEAKRIRFEREVQAHHRQLKESIPRFIRTGRLRNLLTAPIIYSMILPLAVLDLWFTVYQTLCFPVYGIPRVRRSQYLIIDRHHLSYLNGVEKLNCVYCGYANGLAYVRCANRTLLVPDQARYSRNRTASPLSSVRGLRRRTRIQTGTPATAECLR